jgi:hypothetical protein
MSDSASMARQHIISLRLVLNYTLGIDELLAKHIAYLFIRDPIVIFSEMIDQDDEKDNDHFEVRYLHRYDISVQAQFDSEYPINQLANRTLQAARKLYYGMAC